MSSCINVYTIWTTSKHLCKSYKKLIGVNCVVLQVHKSHLICFTIALLHCTINIFQKSGWKEDITIKNPWLTEALRISIKHKNKLYYIYQKVKSVSNELNYKRYKSKLQNILKKAEKAYFHDLLLNHSNDIRKSWVIIKGIIHKNRKEQVQTKFKLQDGNVTAEKAIISNKFNDFFCQYWAYSFKSNTKWQQIANRLSWRYN